MVASFDISQGENLISLAVAAQRFPGCGGAKHTNPATLWRWAAQGIRAANGDIVKLKVIRAGSRWFTTASSIKEFVDSLTSSEPLPTTPTRTPAKSRRAAEAAGNRLAAMGA